MRFAYRKAKRKPVLTPKQKQSWSVDDWKKVIFGDESQICIGQGEDPRTYVWHHSEENIQISPLIYDMGLDGNHYLNSQCTGVH